MSQTELKDKPQFAFESLPSQSVERFKNAVKKMAEFSDSTPETDSSRKDTLQVSPDEQKAVATVMEQAKTPEQEREFLREVDPRNSRDYFETSYQIWARDNTRTYTNLASIRSKVGFWLGSTFVANPADKGVPDYVWYLQKDRPIVFSGHLNAKDYSQNDKNILQTNRIILELRDTVQKRIAFCFLIFGLAFGTFSFTATKVKDGYNYVSNTIAASGDKEKFKEQQLKTLKKDATALFLDQKAGKLTDEQFFERKKELVEREKAINKQ